MSVKAKYDYHLVRYKNQDVLLIIDHNIGSMSLTNDIENVVEEIEDKEHIDAKNYLIVYRDSAGVWDGWEKSKDKMGQFVLLGQQKEWQSAIDNYLKCLPVER